MKWFIQRFFQELCSPQTKLNKILSFYLKNPIYWLFIKPINFLRKMKQMSHLVEQDALLLIYDLSIEPVTYNFIFPLVTASYQCAKQQCRYLDVLLIKGEYHDLRKEEVDYEQAFSIDARHWRVQSILIDSLNLVPNFRHLFCINKKQAAVCLSQYIHKYPRYYTVTAPVTYFSRDVFVSDPGIRCLRADKQSLRMVANWLTLHAKGRKIITITLRQSIYCPKRNSHVTHWVRLAKSLDPQRYCVIFVLDTEADGLKVHQLEGFDCCIAASVSVPLRMALYQLSFLCLGINNGPMALCWFSDHCNYITFKIITEAVPQTTKQAVIRYGFTLGETPVFARPYQWWVWENDDYPVLHEKVHALLDLLETTHAPLKIE